MKMTLSQLGGVWRFHKSFLIMVGVLLLTLLATSVIEAQTVLPYSNSVEVEEGVFKLDGHTDLLATSQSNRMASESISQVGLEEFIISGTVRDFDGSPLENVRVSTNPAYRSDLTDTNGVYTLTVPAGTYRVTPNKFFDARDPLAQTVIVPPRRTNVDFTFPERFTIRGAVRDYDGTPLQGAYVYASGPVIDSELTAANGTYTFTLPMGMYQVSAGHRDYPAPAPQFVSIPPSLTNVNLIFPVRPGARLAGEGWTRTVCAAAGGVTVHFHGQIYNRTADVTGQNVRLWIPGSQNLPLTVTPSEIATMPPEQRFPVTITMNIPADLAPGIYDGVLLAQGANTDYLWLSATLSLGFPCGGGHLALDGVDDYAETPDHPELDINREAGESLTVEGWFSLDVSKPVTTTRAEALACKWQSYCLYLQREPNASSALTFLLWKDATHTYFWSVSFNGVAAAGWHHVAGIFDNTKDEVRLYHDGVLWFSDPYTNAIHISEAPLYVGGVIDASFLRGTVDEVRISDIPRYVDSSFTVSRTSFVCDANTRGLWHFEEEDGAIEMHDACGVDNLLRGQQGAHVSNCVYTISPSSQFFLQDGGTGSVSVSTTDLCAWTALSQNEWITVTANSSGTGNGSVTYTVAPNLDAITRTGNLLIATHPFTVTQAGICTYTLSPTSASFQASMGKGSINVTAPAGCTWTTVSNTDWITIAAGAAGNGNGILTYDVAANPHTETRTGVLTIAGQPFTVSQTGIGLPSEVYKVYLPIIFLPCPETP